MSKAKFDLEFGKLAAIGAVNIIQPFCQRVKIAGSIRRQKPLVGDIEIVALPIVRTEYNLFGEPGPPQSVLDDQNWAALGRVIKNGSRFKQIVFSNGLTLDLFIVMPPAQWGVIYAIRTGPADFSRWIVTPRKHGGVLPSDCRVRNGAVWRAGKIIPMPEEINFLEFIGLGWVAPEHRQPQTLPTFVDIR